MVKLGKVCVNKAIKIYLLLKKELSLRQHTNTDVEEDHSKTNLFAGVSARRSYKCACKMLDKETVTLQLQRRVNKMVGTEEHLVEIKFVPK
jgi:hypothetical protein